MKQKRSMAVVIAITIQKLADGVIGGWTVEEGLVLVALRRSKNSLNEATDVELGDYINSLSSEQLRGVLSNVKGIYHELLFARAENLDGDQIQAAVFEETNHPGADVEFTVDGEVISAVQLKAVSSPSSILEHIDRYPSIDVFATSEVAATMPGVEDSGFSLDELNRDVKDTFSQIADGGLAENMVGSGGVSALVAGAILARQRLNGQGLNGEELKGLLKDLGIGSIAALVIDGILSVA